MPTQLPTRANLDHFKKQAKALLKAIRSADSTAVDRFSKHHPNYASGVDDASAPKLQEAQLVIAREHAFASWPQLVQALSVANETEADGSGILILTNGMAAIDALNRAEIVGRKEEWLEVLHDGPVPLTPRREELNRIRAQHISALGWSSEEATFNRFQKRDRLLNKASDFQELVLCFEHDLYDQLQLIQILDTLADKVEWLSKTKLVQTDQFITDTTEESLSKAFESPVEISTEHTTLARNAWAAFRHPNSDKLEELLQEDLGALPYLRAAIARLVQEFPDTQSGLGRTERQILEIVAPEAQQPGSLFRQNQEREEAAYMGDLSFFQIVDRLTRADTPPIATEGVPHFFADANPLKAESFNNRRIHLTDTGKEILAGKSRHQTPAYWIGGCKFA